MMMMMMMIIIIIIIKRRKDMTQKISAFVTEFGSFIKQVRLIKMCLIETYI